MQRATNLPRVFLFTARRPSSVPRAIFFSRGASDTSREALREPRAQRARNPEFMRVCAMRAMSAHSHSSFDHRARSFRAANGKFPQRALRRICDDGSGDFARAKKSVASMIVDMRVADRDRKRDRFTRCARASHGKPSHPPHDPVAHRVTGSSARKNSSLGPKSPFRPRIRDSRGIGRPNRFSSPIATIRTPSRRFAMLRCIDATRLASMIGDAMTNMHE